MEDHFTNMTTSVILETNYIATFLVSPKWNHVYLVFTAGENPKNGAEL